MSEQEQTVVLLGNANPHVQKPVLHPESGAVMGFVSSPAPHIDQSVTRMTMQPGFDDPDFVKLTLSTDNDRHLTNIANALADAHKPYAIGVQHVEQLMDVHAGGRKPDWVTSSDQGFAEALAEYYGVPAEEPKALLTYVGRDALHAQHMSPSQPAPFNAIALTASTTTPAVTDTTLAGEITTAGGGLVRGTATYAHTAGTNTSTLTKTFTANGSDALPVIVAQIGVFNSGGTLGYHTALSSTAPISVSGDNVTTTESVAGG